MHARRVVTVLAAMLLAVPFAMAEEGSKSKKDKAAKIEQQREDIHEMAEKTRDRVIKANEGAKALYDRAYGYAAFRVVKVAVGVTGGGGEGVAIAKEEPELYDPAYMKMATGGVGLGLGGQQYHTLFLFEDEATFHNFVEKGWQADAEANAAAGTEGANVATAFTNGIAVYQLTDKGLIANVDLSGTKFWKDKKLNKSMDDKRTD